MSGHWTRVIPTNRNAPFGASGRRCYRRRGDAQNIGACLPSVNPMDEG